MEDGGLLGDLPRSRPGNRSPKRDARKTQPPDPEPSPGTPEPAQPGDLAGEALRVAMGAAEAGLKVASRITAEVIRRVPRV